MGYNHRQIIYIMFIVIIFMYLMDYLNQNILQLPFESYHYKCVTNKNMTADININ